MPVLNRMQPRRYSKATRTPTSTFGDLKRARVDKVTEFSYSLQIALNERITPNVAIAFPSKFTESTELDLDDGPVRVVAFVEAAEDPYDW